MNVCLSTGGKALLSGFITGMRKNIVSAKPRQFCMIDFRGYGEVMDWLRSQPVVMQAFLAGLFTWGCTIVGSAVVFFFKKVSRKLLNIMMGFAAGAMIFVVVEELIPDSQTNGNTDVATLGLKVGFVLMMVLDVALG